MKKALIVLTLFISAMHAGAATRVKLATLAPSGTSFHVALQEMGQEWRKAGVELTIYPDGNMGSESEMVKRVRTGQLQAAMLTVTGLAEIDTGSTALQEMPMIFRDLGEVDYVREHLQPLLAERLRKKGFVVLFWGDAGWVRFFSRRPAVTPSDFQHMKVFTVAGDSRHVDLMRRLGYDPVPLEYSDALMSLQTGIIDAVPTAPFHALAGQYYRVAKHMVEVNWAPLVGALVIRSSTWDAIPAATQVKLLQAATAAGKKIQERGRSESDEAVAAMVKRGLVVHKLTPAARNEWERLARTAYPEIRGHRVPADLFDEVQRLLAARRAARPQ